MRDYLKHVRHSLLMEQSYLFIFYYLSSRFTIQTNATVFIWKSLFIFLLFIYTLYEFNHKHAIVFTWSIMFFFYLFIHAYTYFLIKLFRNDVLSNFSFHTLNIKCKGVHILKTNKQGQGRKYGHTNISLSLWSSRRAVLWSLPQTSASVRCLTTAMHLVLITHASIHLPRTHTLLDPPRRPPRRTALVPPPRPPPRRNDKYEKED